MPTTVRVRDEDKRALDRLQATITLREGSRVSLDEVLHRLVLLGEARADELLRDEAPKLTKDQKAFLLALPADFGVRTSEETIDEELYGWRKGREA